MDDQVYVRSGRGLTGPYLVSAITSVGKYVLSEEDGTEVEAKREFGESELEHTPS